MTNPDEMHATAAVAAPCDDPLKVPAWWDYDGEGAFKRADRQAYFVSGMLNVPVFVVVRSERSAHCMAPVLIAWERLVKWAKSSGADVKAAEIAVQRGAQFLRISERPYDKGPVVFCYMPHAREWPTRVRLDLEQFAAVGTYAATLSKRTLVATYFQERKRDA